MSVTLQELIDRAVSIASRGQEPSLASSLAAEMITEDLLITVFDAVSTKLAGDPATRGLLRRTKTIAFVNGSGTVTEDVLTEYLCESMLYNSSSLTAQYSYINQWENFIRQHDTRLGSYCVNESTIAVVEPGAVYAAGSGLTGSRSLVTPCAVAIPAAAGTAISARDEVVDELITALADSLLNPIWKIAEPQRVKVA